jgi:Flp pilus assembly protein TadB
MVPFLFLTIQVVNPVYIKPLYHGSGLVLLVGSGISVLAGLICILRMVKIDV